MKKLFGFIISFIMVIVLFPATGFSAKPLPPLNISITPVQSNISSDQIKPGDVIEFNITAVSSIDTQEMRIEVHMAGGASVVSGETTWTGPAAKSEEKTIMLTVKAPEKGQGGIRARASLPSSNHSRFSAEAFFALGPQPEEKQAQEPVKKKNSKGRDIIEYH